MIDGLLKDQTNSIITQFFRYTIVGGAAFAVDISLLVILTEVLGLPYLASAAIAFILGLIVNYALSIIWVFSKRTLSNKWIELGIFALIGIIGLGLNELIMWFLTEYIDFHYLLSKVTSTIVIYLWNFSARKLLLFT